MANFYGPYPTEVAMHLTVTELRQQGLRPEQAKTGFATELASFVGDVALPRNALELYGTLRPTSAEDIAALGRLCDRAAATGRRGPTPTDAAEEALKDTLTALNAGHSAQGVRITMDLGLMPPLSPHELAVGDLSAISIVERALLGLVSRGVLVSSVARKLGLGAPGLNAHMNDTYRRLGVTNAEDAVRRGLSLGVLLHDSDICGIQAPFGRRSA